MECFLHQWVKSAFPFIGSPIFVYRKNARAKLNKRETLFGLPELMHNLIGKEGSRELVGHNPAVKTEPTLLQTLR